MSDDLLMNIHVDDVEKRLYVSRPKENKSGALSPCNMSPDDVDYEMSKGMDKRILEICGMNQESLESFVDKYGQTYESLYFFKCQLISDFSPLAKLKNLKAVRIYWNIRSDGLWDMTENESLTHLDISDSKIITRNLKLLKTGKNLKYIKLSGGMFEKYPLEDLSVFENMQSLESLTLYDIKLGDRNTAFLKTLPNLTEFHFDAGMFTTEEIAYIFRLIELPLQPVEAAAGVIVSCHNISSCFAVIIAVVPGAGEAPAVGVGQGTMSLESTV